MERIGTHRSSALRLPLLLDRPTIPPGSSRTASPELIYRGTRVGGLGRWRRCQRIPGKTIDPNIAPGRDSGDDLMPRGRCCQGSAGLALARGRPSTRRAHAAVASGRHVHVAPMTGRSPETRKLITLAAVSFPAQRGSAAKTMVTRRLSPAGSWPPRLTQQNANISPVRPGRPTGRRSVDPGRAESESPRHSTK